MEPTRAQKRAARDYIAAYHAAQLEELLGHVRAALARHDAGEIDAFSVDAVIHRYQRAAHELYKLCVLSARGSHAPTIARLLKQEAATGEDRDWWEAAAPRRG